jgi:hypothetical protein
MIIREYSPLDLGRLLQIHSQNGLPSNCFPEVVTQDQRTGLVVENPLFVVKEVIDHEGQPVMAGFAGVTAEVFLVVDHTAGTPEDRMEWLRELTKMVASKAWARGLNELTAWVPPSLVDSFEKRLIGLGFVKSPWQSYTLPLNEAVVSGDKVLEVSSGSGSKSQA